MKIYFISIFSIFFTLSCGLVEPKVQALDKLSGITIKSGQNFGLCFGKCYSEITIKGSELLLVVKERSFDNELLINKDYSYTELISAEKIEEYRKALNIDSFFKLKEVYGCPDCADGGSEWIEIITSDKISKKVTFEYGQNIPQIENLIKLLRLERTSLLKKYVNK